jgi:hypothetical protein
MAMNLEKRMEMERKAVRNLVREMKKAGWMPVNVFDGDENVAVSNESDVMENVFAVDEANIVFRKAIVPFIPMRRTVVVVLGNDGYDCLADCSVSNPNIPADDFSAVMDGPVADYCEKLELAA